VGLVENSLGQVAVNILSRLLLDLVKTRSVNVMATCQVGCRNNETC
jgi:hypothetical protein